MSDIIGQYQNFMWQGSLSIEELHEAIVSGSLAENDIQQKVESLRAASTDEERTLIKKSLPAITLAGDFGDDRVATHTLAAYIGLIQIDTKKYYANTYTLIIAPPATGKGAIEDVKSFGMQINKKLYAEYLNEKERSGEDDPEPVLEKIIIAGNVSTAGRIEDMGNNGGSGIVMESEADTISASNKQDWGGTSYMERQAFEHESIQTKRKGESISLPTPKLTTVVAGTPDQVKPYLESAENGLFSRYGFYVFESSPVWRDQFAVADTGIDSKLKSVSDYVSDFHDYYRSYSFKFTVSEQCRNQFNEIFEAKCDGLSAYDIESASIYRLGVITVRNAMILTAIREFDNKSGRFEIQCDEDIWQASLELMEVLYEHMLKAITLVGGNVSPKERFYDSLPMQFTTQEAQKLGEEHGIRKRTVERRLESFIKDSRLMRVSHGNYSKPYG